MIENILEFINDYRVLYIISILGASYAILAAFFKRVNKKKRFLVSSGVSLVFGIVTWLLTDLDAYWIVGIGVCTASFYSFLITPLVKVLKFIENSANGKTVKDIFKKN